MVYLRLRGIHVLLAAALGAIACQRPAQGKTDGSGAAAPEVQLTAVRAARLDRTINVSGALAAEDQSVLSMKVAGRLAALNVDLGSAVTAGQPLASIEPTDFTLRVAQADAALKQARARLGLADGDNDRVEPEKTAIVGRRRRSSTKQS